MALWFEKGWGNGYQLGIWKLDEPESYFTARLDLLSVEQEELAKIKGRRRVEWLASRHLIHLMLTEKPEWDRIPLIKDEFGKPHLYGTLLDLSFSHSQEFAAVIIANKKTGIDIQKFVPRINAIAHKFMRDEELESLDENYRLEHLHFYWGAKEALYKSYGRKLLDFRENIIVKPFEYQLITQSEGAVSKDSFYMEHELFYEKIGDYFLVFSLERPLNPES